jgi:hypothetical protein
MAAAAFRTWAGISQQVKEEFRFLPIAPFYFHLPSLTVGRNIYRFGFSWIFTQNKFLSIIFQNNLSTLV